MITMTTCHAPFMLRARIDALQLGDIVELLHETDERYDLFIVADAVTVHGFRVYLNL